jgi:DNA-binding transcriptional LysR family regulator
MSYDGFKNITLQQLEALIHLVAERSFSRAAKKMFLTQPSLTKHIKNLEDAVGAKVINRLNTGVTLTLQGKILYEYAQKVMALKEGVKEKILQSMEKDSGTVDVIASTIPANYILPCILGEFNRNYPKIKVYIKTVNSEEALDMVVNRHAELGFIGKKPLSRKINAEPIWKDRLIIAVSGAHRWSGKRAITAKDLMEEPFVTREKGSGTREILENYFKENAGPDFRLNIVAELGSSEAIKEAMMAGLGISFISIHAIRRELEQKLLMEIPVSGWVVERDFYVIYTKQHKLMPHQEIFLDYCKTARVD